MYGHIADRYGHLADRSVYSVYTNLLGVGFRLPTALPGDLATSTSSGTCFNVNDSHTATTNRAGPCTSREHE